MSAQEQHERLTKPREIFKINWKSTGIIIKICSANLCRFFSAVFHLCSFHCLSLFLLNVTLLFLKLLILQLAYSSLCGKIGLASCVALEKSASLIHIAMNYTGAISLNYQDRNKLGG